MTESVRGYESLLNKSSLFLPHRKTHDKLSFPRVRRSVVPF